ncbi:hypothetical protein ACHAWF_017689 [Thalassiosira exigua]
MQRRRGRVHLNDSRRGPRLVATAADGAATATIEVEEERAGRGTTTTCRPWRRRGRRRTKGNGGSIGRSGSDGTWPTTRPTTRTPTARTSTAKATTTTPTTTAISTSSDGERTRGPDDPLCHPLDRVLDGSALDDSGMTHESFPDDESARGFGTRMSRKCRKSTTKSQTEGTKSRGRGEETSGRRSRGATRGCRWVFSSTSFGCFSRLRSFRETRSFCHDAGGGGGRRSPETEMDKERASASRSPLRVLLRRRRGIVRFQRLRDVFADPVHGRDDEVADALRTFVRRRKNNPCLTGEPGVGKTAIAEGVAQILAAPNMLEQLDELFDRGEDGAFVKAKEVPRD